MPRSSFFISDGLGRLHRGLRAALGCTRGCAVMYRHDGKRRQQDAARMLHAQRHDLPEGRMVFSHVTVIARLFPPQSVVDLTSSPTKVTQYPASSMPSLSPSTGASALNRQTDTMHHMLGSAVRTALPTLDVQQQAIAEGGTNAHIVSPQLAHRLANRPNAELGANVSAYLHMMRLNRCEGAQEAMEERGMDFEPWLYGSYAEAPEIWATRTNGVIREGVHQGGMAVVVWM
ncbi:hypothetical protein DICSQDRAFT_181734 [Dichomitus squalens LYAD-421 SS1]|uniref:Uncharacterized protein n=1 Tax=Dichomitus squalens (strain LYAD-421) TaxID=732165 RepID=R7SXQ7_DICSQ|nr:uncharacterized protein DICSQDRAFT_181734 [Dichomitus squalens LYAD-421 SS1]EJF59757.1 hypothetical protein DICSQDRAFT_181734 [Dichomitus squalens LYAD-421 SS1]